MKVRVIRAFSTYVVGTILDPIGKAHRDELIHRGFCEPYEEAPPLAAKVKRARTIKVAVKPKGES